MDRTFGHKGRPSVFRMAALAAIGAALVSFSGCATIGGPGIDVSAVEKIIFDVNQGDFEELIRLSMVPFVFDREIIMRESDVVLLWTGLTNGGFNLPGGKVTGTEKLSPESYTVFSESWEMKVFFEKYVPKQAYIAYVSADGRRTAFLLGKSADGTARIYGIGGYR